MTYATKDLLNCMLSSLLFAVGRPELTFVLRRRFRSERASEGGTIRPALWSSRGGGCASRTAQHIELGRPTAAAAAARFATIALPLSVNVM